MIDPLILLAFLPAGLALNLTPGADMMFCLAQGLRRGPRAAWAASAGISAGSLVHAIVAGLGLAAVIAAHPGVLNVIRWIGVAYLLWLAVKSLRATRSKIPDTAPAHAFREGLMVNLTNPKVILFVLAFIPQFIDPARPVLPQFLIFGALLGLGGLVINGMVGQLAGGAGNRLARSEGFARWLGRISAGVFGLLALRLATMRTQ
ncbi:threonine transporter RhtB [Primorskyibacter flagellatus]|uniref:Threonine transporter RhtB n=1 Tax=Primorskyibacter flagellatus TaxID=1387277 RepID=A0A917ABN9_9RHOB|nr:LysE family translocator [Primorskyibacter flagellatus]GGE40848.1 threonine transporter RhtB [Primorskyibacter flagellatus]